MDDAYWLNNGFHWGSKSREESGAALTLFLAYYVSSYK